MADSPKSSGVPWPLFILGLVLVVTSAIAIFLLRDDEEPDSATDPDTTSSASPDAGESSTPDEPASTSPLAAPIYFVGETPRGLGLYTELHSATSDDLLSSAVDLAVSQDPLDPDYQQPWPAGVRAVASYDGDVITVDLASNGVALRERGDLSADEAAMAIEQVIFTAQGAADDGRPGVQFLVDGERTDQVLGQPTAEPLANGPVLETLSLINITTPGEGGVTSGSLMVQGLSNSFEANVIVTLEGEGGVVFEEGVMADGWMGEELFPFAGSFDLAGVEPGTYVVTAKTDDPSGGEEGFGPFEDTKTITIE